MVKRNWSDFIEYESIIELYDFLEDDCDVIFNHECDFKSAISESLDHDRRDKKLRSIVVRYGRKEFREAMFVVFGGACCITKCNEKTVLEAAHITPYMGHHSNILDNGLLLRVDVHRLFDNFLITIDPESFKVIVSKKLSSFYHKELVRAYIPKGHTKEFRRILYRHYKTFLKKENSL